VFAASGDSGANGRSDGECLNPYLNALYPAASPYITAVGATEPHNPTYGGLNNAPAVCSQNNWTCVTGGGQAAVSFTYSQYTSGGGFSNYSSMPSFQTAAVAAYFKSGVKMPPASYYNRKGKAIPDASSWQIEQTTVNSPVNIPQLY
jgi:tripeptidyl-peptidase-1